MRRLLFALGLIIVSVFGVIVFHNTEELNNSVIVAEYTILPENIHKSQRDHREYQAIKLANNMTVLLVSDSQSPKSLASLSLPVGSLYDPVSQQGLAHYTEHMVLMGSENYPEPDSFSEFLSQNAGSYNASTAGFRTSYYFEVDRGALAGALDRLADAIAVPLLDPTYSDKERNAVNAEMTMARSNDGFRIGQVDSETLNPKHPASLFNGGNLETLSDKEGSKLHDELTQFYQKYYSANLMVGVIYSQQSLSELADLAVASFGRIQDKQATVEPLTEVAIDKEHVGKMIFMQPAQPKKLLYIQFPIENNLAKFADKSDTYIAYLIGNRSEGTLANQLQSDELIESISAGASPNRYGNSGIFAITASLTDKGLKEKDQVIAAIFSYLDLLKEQGISQDYYNEIQRVLNIEFEYPDIYRNMSYVEWLTDQMLMYPLTHVLDADYVTTNFNISDINARLDQLTPENARIWIIAPDQPYDKEAYFVQAPYQMTQITAQQYQNWQELGKQWQFVLPELNPYIPDDFLLVSTTELAKNRMQQFNPKGNNLYIQSEYFADEPKMAMALSLRGNDLLNDAKQQVEFELLDYIVSRSLAQLRYQASVAGMTLSTRSDNGLMIYASGFSQHLPEMMMSVLTDYRQVKLTENELALAKSWYAERLNAADSANSYMLAMQPLQSLSVPFYTDRAARRAILNEITVSDLEAYRTLLFDKSVPYLLTMGNISDDQRNEFFAIIKQETSPSASYVPVVPITINDPTKAIISQQAMSTDFGLAMVYAPINYDEYTGRAHSALLGNIIHPWFYTQLRSEEQLGYAVFAFPANIGRSSGIGFLIQSNQYDPNYLYQRYNNFYPEALAKFEAMSEEDFTQYKQGLRNELLEAPQTLAEEFSRYFGDFSLSRFDFDSRQRIVAAVDNITKESLLEYYQSAVLDQDGLVFASQVMGKDNNGKGLQAKELTRYDNAEQLQQEIIK